MYAVQKKDFIGQWVDVYRAQKFEDASKFQKSMTGGSAKVVTRIIQQ